MCIEAWRSPLNWKHDTNFLCLPSKLKYRCHNTNNRRFCVKLIRFVLTDWVNINSFISVKFRIILTNKVSECTIFRLEILRKRAAASLSWIVIFPSSSNLPNTLLNMQISVLWYRKFCSKWENVAHCYKLNVLKCLIGRVHHNEKLSGIWSRILQGVAENTGLGCF
jgi:hypothetical protein